MLRAERFPVSRHDTVTFRWLPGRNKMHNAIANQIAPSHLFQRFPQQGPVVGVVIPQKRLM